MFRKFAFALTVALSLFGSQRDTDPIGIFKSLSNNDSEAVVTQKLGNPPITIRSSDGLMKAIVYTEGNREGWVIFEGGQMKSRGTAPKGTMATKHLDDFQKATRRTAK